MLEFENFEYHGEEAAHGCGVVFKGEYLYFGGYSSAIRQVSSR